MPRIYIYIYILSSQQAGLQAIKRLTSKQASRLNMGLPRQASKLELDGLTCLLISKSDKGPIGKKWKSSPRKPFIKPDPDGPSREAFIKSDPESIALSTRTKMKH